VRLGVSPLGRPALRGRSGTPIAIGAPQAEGTTCLIGPEGRASRTSGARHHLLEPVHAVLAAGDYLMELEVREAFVRVAA